jgi:hypothetical protein
MDSLLLKWVRESLNRLFLQSPSFFKVWQKIGVALMLVFGIPEALEEINKLFQLDIWQYVPEPIRFFANKTFAAVGLTIRIMASLVITPTNPTPVTKDGNEASSNAKLPFTNRK